jgi:hypothetical protein
VLAFFAGGYFDTPRAWAGLIAWILVVVAALAAPRRGLVRRSGMLAVLGLALLAAWTLLSMLWAPIVGSAYHAGQIVVLYLGMLLAAIGLLGDRRWQRAVEPALAAGILIVMGYAVSERFLPGLLHFQRSVSAQGRLEQPLTYWNAMGELAALGLVLCTRVAGNTARASWMRVAAVAAAAPVGLGLYLSFSRGALFAAAAGLLALLLLAPTVEQLKTIGLAIAATVLAAASAAPFRAVTNLAGTQSTRERDGAIALGLLALVVAIIALIQWRLLRDETPRRLRLPPRAPVIATVIICAGLALAIVVGAKEHARRPLGASTTRYVTLQSNRYAYWRVALRAFGDEPLRGVGAGGWAVYWLRYRPIDEFAQDAHSLPLQTLAELGVIGALILLLFLGGVGFAARDAVAAAPGLAAGPAAGFVAWLAHQPLDWDWQMPAVTLVAIVLAGQLIAVTAPRRSAELPG